MTKFTDFLNKMGYSWNDFDRTYEMENLIEQYADEAIKEALQQAHVISSVCTCTNSETEKHSLVPVFCHNCNAYVQTDL